MRIKNERSDHSFIRCYLSLFRSGYRCFRRTRLANILQVNATKDIFETGSQYHFIHALALLWLGLYRSNLNAEQGRYLSLTTYLFLIGTLIFSGSLYCLAITNVRWLGAITPIGGILLLSAWFMTALNLIKQRDQYLN